MILDIYVPREGTPAARSVLPGSAIVGGGFPADGGHIMVDYEGNMYKTPAMSLFNHRLLHAAGRHVKHYPTTARSLFKRDDLICVGRYDATRWVVKSIDDPAAAEAWSGEAVDSIIGPRLPAGPAQWSEVHLLTAEDSGVQPLAGNRPAAGMMWFRTRAGQVVGFGEGKVAIVYDHDSQALRGLLGPHLRPEEVGKVFGD